MTSIHDVTKTVFLRPARTAPATARAEVRRALESMLLPRGRVDDAALVAGLFVRESVRRTSTDMRLRISLSTIEDGGREQPLPRRGSGFSPDIVERISQAWGFPEVPTDQQLRTRPSVRIVSISIDDEGRELPLSVGGNGYTLDLVGRLAQSWGFHRTASGRQLWARLSVDSASQDASRPEAVAV